MKIAIIIIIMVFLTIAVFLIRSGLFVKPNVTQKIMSEIFFVYQDHVGPYQETGKIQDEIYEYLITTYQVETTKGIGIYYDNPQKVPKEQLRSKAGCIIPQTEIEKLSKLSPKYKTMTLKEQEMVYSDFPFRNKFSIFLGIIKVYPLMQKYCTENGYIFRESIEIYDMPGKKILYLMPID